MTGTSGSSWRYLYERLGEKRFQQLCGALLAHAFPDVVCYPVGQKDGGRDAARLDRGRRLVYQVKWTNRRLRDPVAWLDGAVREEAANIRRLVSEGADEYIMLTCVAGTAARGGAPWTVSTSACRSTRGTSAYLCLAGGRQT